MNKPKHQAKRLASPVINKRILPTDQIPPQSDFTPDQLREIAFRCERALSSTVQPATLEFDEWA